MRIIGSGDGLGLRLAKFLGGDFESNELGVAEGGGDGHVGGVAAARHQDAVELAMTAPAVVPHLQNAVVRATPEPLVANAPIQLASLGPVIGPPDIPSIVLPATLSVLPPPAPGVPPPSPAQRLKLEGKDRAKAEKCLATAIYFEARSEPVDGQLAVAEVVLNRAGSGQYPTTICEVVTQPWQFSFVNATGRIPEADRGSQAWRKAVAISRIALDEAADRVPADVLRDHADYVSPSWGRRLNEFDKIGVHIFYS